MLRTLALLAAAAASGLAATVEREWSIERVEAAPDGHSRPVIGINGQWPCPSLEVNAGDKVVVHVTNNMDDEATSLHWHGIFQEGNTLMDGASNVSQCPIPPGKSFTYEFEATHPGTYWYHAHIGAQYSEGLRGPLIVHDKKDSRDDVEEEYILTVSDWYHDQTSQLLEGLIDISNVNVRPPLPDSCLVNDGQKGHYKIEPGKKYRFRIINMSALAGAAVWIDSHKLSVVEVDGVSTEPADAEHLYVTPGQRYSVIVEGKKGGDENYAINAVLDMNPEVLQPIPQVGFPLNGTAVLEYDGSKPKPNATTVDKFDVIDDLTLKPLDGMKLLGDPDQQIQLDFHLGLDDDGKPRAYLNNVSYVSQETPTLYTALTSGKDAEDPETYGQINPFVIKKEEIIEITLNNLSPSHHPFHLHGHHFQVLSRGGPGGGGAVEARDEDFASVPMRRDTVGVNGLSSTVIRFKADNPGVWLFHCHIEWHVPLGMVATFIERPRELQKSLKSIPKEQLGICEAQGLSTEGLAAGSTKDVDDLPGAGSGTYIPSKGLVALVCLVLSWSWLTV